MRLALAGILIVTWLPTALGGDEATFRGRTTTEWAEALSRADTDQWDDLIESLGEANDDAIRVLDRLLQWRDATVVEGALLAVESAKSRAVPLAGRVVDLVVAGDELTQAAQMALVAIGGGGIPALRTRLVGDRDELVALIEVLVSLPPSRDVYECLSIGARSGSLEVRLQSHRALAALQPEDAFSVRVVVHAALADESPEVRALAARAMEGLGPALGAELPRIVEHVLSDRRARSRSALVSAIESAAGLNALLDRSGARLRPSRIEALLSDPGTVVLGLRLLNAQGPSARVLGPRIASLAQKHPDHEVRVEAIRQLGLVVGAKAHATLLTVAKAAESSGERSAAIWALGRAGVRPEVLDGLLKEATTIEERLTCLVEMAYGGGGAEVSRKLAELAGPASPRGVRLRALQALGEVPPTPESIASAAAAVTGRDSALAREGCEILRRYLAQGGEHFLDVRRRLSTLVTAVEDAEGRLRIAWALGWSKGGEADAAIRALEVLREEDESALVRFAASVGVSRLTGHGDELAESLCAADARTDAVEEAEVIRAIWALTSDPARVRERVDALVRRASADVVGRLVEWMGGSGDGLRECRQLLASHLCEQLSDVSVVPVDPVIHEGLFGAGWRVEGREAAAHLLLDLCPDALPAVRKVARDDGPYAVRRRAIVILSEFKGDSESALLLAEVLRNPKVDERLRWAAANALGRIGVTGTSIDEALASGVGARSDRLSLQSIDAFATLQWAGSAGRKSLREALRSAERRAAAEYALSTAE